MTATTNISKNYALVTGSSSGMGLEYVRQLADKGYNIIIVALFQNETDVVKEEIKNKHPELDVISIGMDLSAIDSATILYEKVKEYPIEVLINNAGVLYPYHFKNTTYEQVSRIILIHNHTLALMCKLFSKGMIERGKGYILNISSLAVWFPYPFISLYSATKAFTRNFSKALRIELMGTGVSVSTIYFGAVATNLYHISKTWTKIALAIGVMTTAPKAARRALRMMFWRRSGWVPGLVNKIAILLAALLPPCLINPIEKWVTRKWNLK